MDGKLRDSNQHYITKAYLDKFVHPRSPQKVLYPYRKGGKHSKPSGTKRLGSAQNFYRQKENGQPNDNLDNARKVTETLLFAGDRGSLFKCITDERFMPTDVDKLHLATATSFLWCGSPVQIHNSAMFRLLHHQIDLLNWHNTEEAKQCYRDDHGDAADEKREADRQRVLKGDLFVDVGEENWKQLGFSSFQIQENVIHEMLAMRMTIVDCHFRCFFLASDNPVLAIPPSSPEKRDEQMWIPISYNRGILWHRRADLGVRTCFGYSETHAINRQIIKMCYKRVYSPLPESWIESAGSQEKHDPLWGHYGSLEKVRAD
jgi:hypothetical protein